MVYTYLIKEKILRLQEENLSARKDLADNGANYDVAKLDELCKTIDCTGYAVTILRELL